MDNFAILTHYSIPSDVLMEMLKTYRLLGMNNEYKKKINDKIDYITSDVIEKDTFFITRMLNLDISDNRLRLLITKEAVPKSKTEEMVIGIKKVIKRLHNNSSQKLTFNGSDILDDLNLIFGKKEIGFSKEMIRIKNNPRPISIRLTYERVLDEYHKWRLEKKFESIFLSVICYMEIVNLQPYTSENYLASYLALYYMILLSDVEVFRYVSFFEILDPLKKQLEEEVKKGSINYWENYLQTTSVVKIIFKIIANAYQGLEDMIKKYYFSERAFKSDVIEQTIYTKMPQYFTKDELRRYHPDASDSTINRILFKLRDEQIIMPLGKGRSAKWMKLINDNDPKYFLGYQIEGEDNE